MRRAAFALAIAACAPAIAPSPPKPPHLFRHGAHETTCRDPGGGGSLREGCASGDAYACHRLGAQEKVSPDDAAFARTRSQEICARDRRVARASPRDPSLAHDRTCDCWLHGSILAWDPKRRFDHEAIELLDEACVAGILDACDEAHLIAEICSVEDTPAPICVELAAQGRVPEPEPVLRPAKLPPALLGCFVVGATSPSTSTGSICAIDPEPCRDVPSATSVLCFDQDRVSTRTAAGWDQARVEWRAYPQRTRFYTDAYELRVERDRVILSTELHDATLAPAPAAIVSEARALPKLEDVCARSHACAEAARKRSPPPADEIDALGPPIPSTLRACEREAREASAIVPCP